MSKKVTSLTLVILAMLAIGFILSWRLTGHQKSVQDWYNQSQQHISNDAVDTKKFKAYPWPNLYGPQHDGSSKETGLLGTWGKTGPPLLWKRPIGLGYSAPSIVDNQMILFHRLKDNEVVECLDITNQKVKWKKSYPTAYEDRYGYSNGPRSTPIIANGVVYTLGAEGKLRAWHFKTGEEQWKRDLNKDYKVEQNFFGVGGSPLLWKDRLIINVGGSKEKSGIVAFSIEDGSELWKATDHGASYATPRHAKIHDKDYVFVFTRKGLVSLDPSSGKVHWEIKHRSRKYESVNATTPVVIDDMVLVSATYGTGSLCLQIKPDGSYKELWKNVESLDSHFSNIIDNNGYLFGFAGRHEGSSDLRCVQLKTGQVQWKKGTILGRGSLLKADNKLYAWGERGHLFCLELDPKKAVLRGFTDPEERKGLLRPPTWTPPVLYNRRLYLRDEHQLLCLDLKAKQ